MEETSGPPADYHRRSADQTGPKRFIRFDPTVSSGTLIQIGSIVILAATAYASYREDRTKFQAELDAGKVSIESVKANAERDRSDSRSAVNEIRSDVKDVKADVSQINKTLAVLEAQGRAKK